MNKNTINLIVGASVAGIIFYLAEEETTLLFIALGGLAYLLFSNGIVRVA